jgi:DNA-binding LacI/PurR family transcriptional regulator
MGSNVTQEARLPLRGDAGVTIRDVAKALNISHTTVSRALADSPKISEDTKSRVRAVVAQMGYLPSASARMMRGRRSSLVGLIIPDVQNDFYATVAKIVADSLASHSMQLLLSVTDDNPDRELRELRAILETRPAGIIIVPTGSPRPESSALLQNVETVQLVRVHADLAGSAVVIDDRAGIKAATRHLLDSGHKRLAFVNGDETFSTGRERLGGFQDALDRFARANACIPCTQRGKGRSVGKGWWRRNIRHPEIIGNGMAAVCRSGVARFPKWEFHPRMWPYR